MPKRRILQLALLSLAFLAPPAAAQAGETAADAEFKAFQRDARQQAERFKKGEAATDPRAELAEKFWAFRAKLAGSALAGEAARDSLRLLVESGRVDAALARLKELPSRDPAWQAGVLTILRELAAAKNDPAIFLRHTTTLLAESTDPAFRARIQFSIGRFYLAGQREKEAVAAFEAAVAEGAETDYGKRSARELYDLRALRIGAPAPDFSVTLVSGKPLTSADLRGHATVFVYWASW